MTAGNLRMIGTTSRGSTVISFLVQLVPEEDDAVSNVEENDDDFVLSSDDEAGDLGSDEETPGDSK